MSRARKPYAPRKQKQIEDERLPTSEQLTKAIKQAEFYLGFAKDYIHNGHLKGATDALKSIKRATTAGLKITGGNNA